MKKTVEKIDKWIKAYFAQAGDDKKAIVGISGGKDSTVCAALLAKALGPDRVIGVQMPCGVQADIEYSDKVFEATGIKKMTVNIGNTYEALCKALNYSDFNGCFSTNAPARIRMTVLYGIAAQENGLVCNTCNYSEEFVGWATKFGDCAGDFSLLSKLTKTQVVELGDYLGLPKELVYKVPDDGMCGLSDEDKMGFTYDELDNWLTNQIKPKKESFDKIMKLHKNPNTRLKLVPMPTALDEDF